MISNRSRLWWQEFSVAGVVIALVSCSAGSTSQPEIVEIDEPGSVSGELAVYVADYEDGTSETSYFLRDSAGNERRLAFETAPADVTPGARIKVWGVDDGETLKVTNIKLARGSVSGDGIESIAQPLIVPAVPIALSVTDSVQVPKAS